MEQTLRLGQHFSVTVQHLADGRIVGVSAIEPVAEAGNGHGVRMLHHAARTVARVFEQLPAEPHDTRALMVQAWAVAALHMANTLRRAEQEAQAAACREGGT